MGLAADRPEGLAQDASTGFQRTLTWKGGFWLALVVPIGGLLTVGFGIGALGAYGALAVWVGTSVIALLQNYIFAELAGLYPDKPGGIALYASEIWARYFAPLGGILGWGYWAGWSLGLAVGALIVGDLVQSQWFPNVTGTITILGAHVGLATSIGVGVLVVVYLVNVSGIRAVVDTNIVIGSAVIILASVCIVGPVLLGHLHGASLTFDAGSGVWGIVVSLFTWAFVASWTAYGTEIAATFTPEYRHPRSDVSRALRSSALVMLVLAALMTTIFPAAIGKQAIADNPVGFFAPLVADVIGRSVSDVIIALLCAAIVISLSSATGDAGRALYGMAADGIAVRQLQRLNRAGQPSRAMTVDLIFNVAVVFVVADVPGVIFASNLGYLVAVVFALAGFLLLRRKRPGAHRLIRLAPIWVPIAAALVIVNSAIIVIGLTHADLIGYGGSRARIIGLSIIPLGLGSYFFARGVQQGVRGRELWRRG